MRQKPYLTPVSPTQTLDNSEKLEYTVAEYKFEYGIPIGQRMTEHGEGRQVQILLAARELLAERGLPTAISVQDVAVRAGTTKVTVYRYFPSKEALFAEVAASLGDGSDLPGRRDQIVAAALRVVPRYGLHGVTMERIAEEAGVSPATLYWHFKNKEDVLLAMVEQMIGQMDIAGIFPPEPLEDADAFMQAVVPPVIRLLEERVNLMPIAMAELTTHPELAAVAYSRVFARVWGAAIAFMAKQTEAGVFRPGHPFLRMQAFIGMLLMYSLARRNFGSLVDLPPPAEAAAEFADLFLHGVVAQDPGDTTHV